MMAVAHFVSDRISWTAAPNEPTVTFQGRSPHHWDSSGDLGRAR